MVLNENMKVDATVTKVSNGIYTLKFQPIYRGNYSMQIKIFDQSESFKYIKNMPATQVVIPDFISLDKSAYAGTGLESGRFGFTESFLVTLKDQYGNNYNQGEIFYNGINNPVFKVTLLANDVDPITALVLSSDPTQGQFKIGYQIVNAYSTLYVRLWIFITTDNGVTYSYLPVNDFPIIVPIVFSPENLLNEYTNLYQGGIGISEYSNTSVTNTLIAGETAAKFMEVYPKNAYFLAYLYDDPKDYLIINAFQVDADN